MNNTGKAIQRTKEYLALLARTPGHKGMPTTREEWEAARELTAAKRRAKHNIARAKSKPTK